MRNAPGSPDLGTHSATHALCVHGFDIRADNYREFDTHFSAVSKTLARFNVEPIRVWTNLRVGETLSWEHSFGARLAGVLHQFSSSHDYGIIASGPEYANPRVAWGSTPGTDYLLSGSRMEIVHDGAGFTRTQKAKAVSADKFLTRSLKVCWAGPEQDSNCGVCEKCVRTKLNFLAVGSARPGCFDNGLTPEMIKRLTVSNNTQLDGLRDVVAFYRGKRSNNPWWITLLDQKIKDIEAELA